MTSYTLSWSSFFNSYNILYSMTEQGDEMQDAGFEESMI